MPTPLSSQLKKHAGEIWQAGVAAVNAERRVAEFVTVTEEHLCFGETKIQHADYDRIIVVGGGKASGWMAAGLELALENRLPKSKILLGRINVPDDQVTSLRSIDVIPCRPPGINLPTERVLDSTAKIIELLANCQPADLVICLIAGGGSALLECPEPPITLADFCAVTRLLSERGASIEELNTVRRQISRIKGGGLARLANCQRMITLIISDVIGDPLGIIASGPTLQNPQSDCTVDEPDPFVKALSVLRRFDPGLATTPESVLEVLQRSFANPTHASPPNVAKTSTSTFTTTVSHFIIGNIQTAVEAAKQKAIELGYDCQSETNATNETAEQAAARLVDRTFNLANSINESQPEFQLRSEFQTQSVLRPRCFVSGGEPTVQLCKNPGRGGRNQQLILAAMEKLLIKNQISEKRLEHDYCFLSAGTDGEDGNVPVAGAVFDSRDLECILASGESDSLSKHLQANDGYPFLKLWDCLLHTPPSKTNVCDLRIILTVPV